MDSPATLKAETEALCLDIEHLEQKLVAKTITFNEAQQQWNAAYRPRSRMLAEAMLPYVPSGDPLAGRVYEDGNLRILNSDAMRCIEMPLVETTASTHLRTVLKHLRDLTNYLPSVTKA